MARPSVEYEWSTVSDDAWPRMTQPATEDNRAGRRPWATEQQLLIQLGRMAVVIVVAWGALASVATPPHLRTQLNTYAAIGPTLHQEAQAWQERDAALLAQLIDPQVKSSVQNEWRVGWDQLPAEVTRATTLLDVRQLDDLMVVQVQVDHPPLEWWLSTPYRETRFYRPDEAGWLRTLPTSAFWQRSQTIETTHLRFTFYEPDATALFAVADRVERAFVQAHEWLALELPPADQKLPFTVVVDVVRGGSGYSARQQLTSPLLAKIPIGLQDDDYLAQQMVSRIASRTVNARMTNYDFTNIYAWDTMVWVLKGWLRTELLDQRTPWHTQAEEHFREHLMPTAPFTLAQIVDRYELDVLDQQTMMLEYILAESVIDYAMARYGPEYLPDLVLGFNRHAGWHGLLKDVFDISPAEFEAGWNHYLRERFDATRDPTMY
jgi:hypothetical protein